MQLRCQEVHTPLGPTHKDWAVEPNRPDVHCVRGHCGIPPYRGSMSEGQPGVIDILPSPTRGGTIANRKHGTGFACLE